MTTRKTVRFAAALALLGMALNALWPLLANAEPRANFFANEICSVNANKAASVTGRLPVQLPAQNHQTEHCALCVSGAGNVPLPGTQPVVVALPADASAAPHAVDPIFAGSRAFLFAVSRAPPAFPLL